MVGKATLALFEQWESPAARDAHRLSPPFLARAAAVEAIAEVCVAGHGSRQQQQLPPPPPRAPPHAFPCALMRSFGISGDH